MEGKYLDHSRDRRRRAKRRAQQRNLILLVIILVVLLAAILILTAVLRNKNPNPENPSGPSGTGSSTTPSTDAPIGLKVAMPETKELSTMDETVTFSGQGDPEQPLTINGQSVPMDETGGFSCQLPLAQGENTFTVAQGSNSLVYTVIRRYAVNSYFPSGDMTYCSEGTVLFEVIARQGSQVSALLDGNKISLQPSADQLGSGAGEGFVLYEGRYSLPKAETDRDLGVITYTVSCDGVTETLTSGDIQCKQAVPVLSSDPSVTPSGGEYLDVGSGLIVEVVSRTAETFDGRTDDDNSNPTRNYLPKGTVDYCSAQLVYNAKAEQSYRVMRCGRRMYEAKRNLPATQRDPVTICYNGTLPDHNEVGFASLSESGNCTVLTLDTMWKAPFYFDMAPQSYTNPDRRDFTISEFTVTHLDITFCYATRFTGEVVIPENHPLFRSAEVIQNESDCTLRLNLRREGGFYGWDSYYNEAGQLCFRFVNPAQVQTANNAYGADLTGVTVMLDVGHGGIDSGTIGKTGGKTYYESNRNLALAEALRTELESMGATVVMNREDDTAVTVEERLAYLKEVSPDLCIAVHHNSSTASGVNGFEVFYFGPVGQLAAKHILQTHQASDVYHSAALMWHYYHLARQSNCPIVLTENGYMSNSEDMADIADDEVTRQKARLIAQGVADYFLDIRL